MLTGYRNKFIEISSKKLVSFLNNYGTNILCSLFYAADPSNFL